MKSKRQLFTPKREDWTTFSVSEWGTDGDWQGCGGFGTLSLGRWEPPIGCVYTFIDENTVRAEVCMIEGDIDNTAYASEDIPENPIHPGKISLVSISYDVERVAEADSEEQAVRDANEYQGGESDWIADLHNSGFGGHTDAQYLYQGEFNCKVDDHDSAIVRILDEVVKALANGE